MEFLNFIKVLLRYKLLLLILPVITVAITYFLVRNQPNTYQSRSRVATGIIDRPDAILNTVFPEVKINQEFGNIIERLVQKRTVTQVSYLLLLHDLNDKTPLRKQSKQMIALTATEKEKAIQLLNQKYKQKQELDLTDEESLKLQDLLVSMGYDEISLKKNLSVYRVNNSDFIDLQFQSENPHLSAFVLNSLCNEFISDYTANLNENKNKTIYYLDSMMRQKQDTLRKKMQALQSYKIRNGVLDVNDQATTLITQIAEFETKRQEAQKNIGAYQGALRNIDARFDPNDRRYVESSLTQLNGEILTSRNRLAAVNEDYIKSNFDPKIKVRADSIQASLTERINQTNDKLAYSPVASRNGLVQEKLNMEISLELAKNGVSSLSTELSRLNGKLYALVPNQAAIKSLQDDIDIFSKEYNELSGKYNQAMLDANFTTKLRQIEIAMPGTKQPSKKLLVILLAGIISFVFCVVVLFIRFFFNASINDPKELANKTDLPVLGYLNLIKGDSLSLQNLWDKESNNQQGNLREFKSLLRSIRFEIDQQLQGQKIITLTSLHEEAGKTFIALNLAYAYKAANKKVIVIDGNFDNPGLTKYTDSKEQLFIEDYLSSDYLESNIRKDELIILGNKGADTSLAEIADHSIITAKLQFLKNNFDVVIIEAPSLTTHGKAKEWIGYSDKIIPVFKTGESFKPSMNGEIEYLKVHEEKVIGWILNKVKIKARGKKQPIVKNSLPVKMVEA